MKAVIIGNSGSGKSWLATRLACLTHAEIDEDEVSRFLEDVRRSAPADRR